jgi:mannitol/fructose-specific phosphotransferase system IIA component (Ntr-type)
MALRDFFADDAVNLALTGQTRDQVLGELVGLLRLDERDSASLLKVLLRREELGSTGVGRGVAIPHGRSLVVSRLRLAFGRHPTGVEWQSIDGRPAFNYFLIVAPPVEMANQYLPVLGKIAQFAKESDTPHRLSEIRSPQEFFDLLAEKGV